MRKPYVILTAMDPSPNQPQERLYSELTQELMDQLLALPADETIACDAETLGLQPYHPDFRLRSFSFHNSRISLAVDLGLVSFEDRNEGLLPQLWQFMTSRHLVLHNAFFDLGIVYRYAGQLPPSFSCTKYLFRMLASEGWIGQSWGLKDAMVDILGWDVNNTELKAWLKSNGLKIGEMSKAPWEILGRYNQLDSAATYELWQHFTSIVNSYEDSWAPYFRGYMLEAYSEYRELLEVNHRGIQIDMDWLAEYTTQVDNDIVSVYSQFREMATVKEHIADFNHAVVQDLVKRQPAQTTASGAIAARWTKWQVAVQKAKEMDHFNSDSNAHLNWLFYDSMGKTPEDFTPKGAPAVNKAALKKLGLEAAKLLEYRKLRDVRKFLTSLSENVIDNKFRPFYKLPGTLTSRLSCGNT